MDLTLFTAAGVIVVVVLLAWAARSLVSAARHASKAISTASELINEVRSAQVAEHENPRSLAATTSLVMPQIQKDFPEFKPR